MRLLSRSRAGNRLLTAESAAPPERDPSRRGLLAAACACCAAGAFGAVLPRPAFAVSPGAARPLHGRMDAAARAVEARMVEWRRDIHQNPELGNQETRTAALVARHLRALG